MGEIETPDELVKRINLSYGNSENAQESLNIITRFANSSHCIPIIFEILEYNELNPRVVFYIIHRIIKISGFAASILLEKQEILINFFKKNLKLFDIPYLREVSSKLFGILFKSNIDEGCSIISSLKNLPIAIRLAAIYISSGIYDPMDVLIDFVSFFDNQHEPQKCDEYANLLVNVLSIFTVKSIPLDLITSLIDSNIIFKKALECSPHVSKSLLESSKMFLSAETDVYKTESMKSKYCNIFISQLIDFMQCELNQSQIYGIIEIYHQIVLTRIIRVSIAAELWEPFVALFFELTVTVFQNGYEESYYQIEIILSIWRQLSFFNIVDLNESERNRMIETYDSVQEQFLSMLFQAPDETLSTMRKDLTQYAIGNFVDLCENNYREVVVKMITCIKTKDIDVSAMSIEVLATMICERRLDLNPKKYHEADLASFYAVHEIAHWVMSESVQTTINFDISIANFMEKLVRATPKDKMKHFCQQTCNELIDLMFYCLRTLRNECLPLNVIRDIIKVIYNEKYPQWFASTVIQNEQILHEISELAYPFLWNSPHREDAKLFVTKVFDLGYTYETPDVVDMLIENLIARMESPEHIENSILFLKGSLSGRRTYACGLFSESVLPRLMQIIESGQALEAISALASDLAKFEKDKQGMTESSYQIYRIISQLLMAIMRRAESQMNPRIISHVFLAYRFIIDNELVNLNVLKIYGDNSFEEVIHLAVECSLNLQEEEPSERLNYRLFGFISSIVKTPELSTSEFFDDLMDLGFIYAAQYLTSSQGVMRLMTDVLGEVLRIGYQPDRQIAKHIIVDILQLFAGGQIQKVCFFPLLSSLIRQVVDDWIPIFTEICRQSGAEEAYEEFMESIFNARKDSERVVTNILNNLMKEMCIVLGNREIMNAFVC